MKKSMLNVITLALVLVNLVLTVILTFSLVSTNNKTNKLVTKVSEILTWMLQVLITAVSQHQLAQA